MNLPKLLSIPLIVYMGIVTSMNANANNQTAQQPPLSREFIQYTLNLYNYTINNRCYMDDILTRDSTLKKSGKIIYWFNGSKREIVDAMVFRIPSSKGVITAFELNGQVSGTYRCLNGPN